MKGLLYFVFLVIWIGAFSSCSIKKQKESNRSVEQALALIQEAQAFDCQTDVKRALVCYWDALELLAQEPDSLLKARTYYQLGDLLFHYGLYEKAVEHHRKSYALSQTLNEKELLLQSLRKLSLSYALLNRQDTAQYFLEKGNRLSLQMKNTSCHLLDTSTLDRLKKQALADSIGSLFLREQLINWETKYQKEKKLLLQEKEQSLALMRTVVFLSVVTLLLFLVFIMYMLKKREEKKRAEQFVWFNQILRETRESLEESRCELKSSAAHIQELQKTMQAHAHTMNSDSLLGRELDFYIQKESELKQKELQLHRQQAMLLSDSSTEAVLLLNKMKQNPTYKPVKTDAQWDILIRFMDILYEGYSQKIKEIKELTLRDREICYLVRLGFTTSQLAVFYGISPGSVTKAKFRIQQKLQAGGMVCLIKETVA